MAVVTGAGVSLKGKDFGTDGSVNSITVAPVAGDSIASGIQQTDANGNVLLKTDTAGNLTANSAQTTAGAAVGTNLTVGGTSTLSGKVTCSGDLQSTAGNTTLGPTTASNFTSLGVARVNSGLTVTGGIDAGSLNSNGDVLVQKKLTVNSSTQTIGLLTASGGLSSPNNGISVVGGTTTDSLVASGNSSLQGTVSTGALTSSSVKSNGNLNVVGSTTLAALTASSSSIAGNETIGGTLGVTGATTLAGTTTGALTASGATVTNNATVGGTLGVTGATTLGALTASSSSIAGSETVAATLTAKNLVLTSGSGGSLTFADGTTMSTAASGTGGSGTSSGSSSGGGLDTIYMGLHNATNGNYPTAYTANNGYFTNTQVIGGTATTTGSAYVSPYAGAIYSLEVFAVSASNPISVNLYKNGVSTALTATSTSAGGSFYALASPAISIAAGDQLQLFIKGTTASMTNSCIGWVTVVPAVSAGSGATPRTAIDMGGYQYGSNSAGGFSATKKVNATAGTNTNASNVDVTIRMPWAGSIVGYSLQQNSSSGGANSIIYSKNGTNYSAINIGSGAGQFWGTHSVSSFPFAAGDKIQLLTGIANGGNTDLIAAIYVQWTDAAGANVGTVTSDPSFNSLTIAPVTGNATPSLITTPSLTLTSGGGGKVTFADGTTQTTAASGSSGSATGSRTVIHMGGIYNTSLSTSNTAFYGIFKGYFNANNLNAYSTPAVYNYYFKAPFPFTVTGWSITNQVNSTLYFQYFKNGSAIGTVTAGTGAAQFNGSHAKGTYSYAAGDQFYLGVNTNNAVYNMEATVVIEWL